jgi:transposase
MHARPVGEQWVFGLFDTTKNRGHIELVENRSSETLLPILQRICLPGTIVVSDGWAAYARISELGFEHRVVVHEDNFVDPSTGVHTNQVENYWQRYKRKFKRICGANREIIPSYLDEFMWLERYAPTFVGRWKNILLHIVENMNHQ